MTAPLALIELSLASTRSDAPLTLAYFVSLAVGETLTALALIGCRVATCWSSDGVAELRRKMQQLLEQGGGELVIGHDQVGITIICRTDL